MRTAALAALIPLALAACGGDDKQKPPPARPATGAPVAVVVDKLGKESVDVSVYNFADQKIASYWLLFRYYDKDGNVLKVKPGTPFESDHDHMSLSGGSYVCPPKKWCNLEVEMLEVPEGAVRADSVVRSVHAVAADGVRIEEEPLYRLEGMDWPEAAAPK